MNQHRQVAVRTILAGALVTSLIACSNDGKQWNDVRGIWTIESYVRTAPNAACGSTTEDILAQIEEPLIVSEALLGGVNADLWVRSCATVEECQAMAETLRGGEPPLSSSSYSAIVIHPDPIAETSITLEGCTVTRPNSLVFVEQVENTLTITERFLEDFTLDDSGECTEEKARAVLPEQCAYESILTAKQRLPLPSL